MRMGTKLSLLVVCSTVFGGCASTGEREQIPPGRVALVAAHYAPESDFNAYASGRGANAAKQAGQTAGKGAAVAAAGPAAVTRVLMVFPPLGMLGLVVTAGAAAAGGVIGGVIGAIDGAANGMPSAQVQAIHQPIDAARRDTEIQTKLAQRLLALNAGRPHHQLAYLPEFGPTSANSETDYRGLKAQGFDAVVEVAVSSIGFAATQGDPPHAAFAMKVRARVVPLTSEGSPWLRMREHKGVSRPLPVWASNEGQLLEGELEEAYRTLANSLSDAVFSPSSTR
jgi:hypothetical protein